MIYIDVGCHNGDTIKDFHKGKFGGIDPKGVRSVGIDPLQTYHKEWQKIMEEYNTEFINKAAFVHNGDIDFSERKGAFDVGSTVMRDKVKYDEGDVYKIESFDFVEYLAGFKKGEVYMRMDVEGAEYPILMKLIDTGVIDRIAYCEIEFHSEKMDEKYKRDEARIIKHLRSISLPFKEMFT